MAHRQLPDADLLRKLLRYEPETGKLFWRPRTPDMFKVPGQCESWNRQFAERQAFKTSDRLGYKTGWVLGRICRAHQVIWKMVTGEMPALVDHINGDPRDNRWPNLRAVNAAANSMNAAMRKDNPSGCTGVVRSKRTGAWLARISVDRKQIYLGHFKTFEDAVRARKAAERKYGFHPNHGRRA